MKKRDPGLAQEIQKLDQMLNRTTAIKERLLRRRAQLEEWLAAHDTHGNAIQEEPMPENEEGEEK